MDKYVGKRLDGRYEITELIGVGGMANVYKANDILEGSVVAVKILKDEFSKNSEFLRRFKNESKAIALLSHPNIVRVVDVSFGDRIQYIVMEYISGITLKQYIEQQKVLTWKEAIHFTVQILRALQHAHDNGIVHRDVKPQNIMLLQDGTIKVMDFGIARFARGDSKTMTDKAIGSVHYISPEQARGDQIDEKTDIYSVGIMLFEMLTGQLPFEADSAVSVAIMQMQAPARKPRAINATIPEGLEEITVRAMQKDPAKRYQSAAEMLRDIDEFKRNPSILFEYKYFGDDDTTKYFDAVTAENAEEDEEVKEKKSHMIPILAGVAAAFVVVSVIVCIVIFGFSDIFEKVPEIEVPDLRGKVYTEVISDPQYSKIKIEQKTTAYSEEYEAGYIIDQEIKAGIKIKEGQTLYVTVSSGLDMLDVPDVVNKPLVEAEDALTKKGLKADIVQQFDSTVAKGNVIRTSPAAGEQVNAGSSVTLYVSMGADQKPIIVPKVLNEMRDAAEAKLKGLGLRCRIQEINSAEPEGTVLSQSLAEGSSARVGDLVVLEVSNGVPDDKTLNFTVNIPTNAANVYQRFTFRVLMDGVEQKTDVVNVSATSNYKFSLTAPATDSHDVRVMVAPQGSSEGEKLFAQYDADFDTGSIQVVTTKANVFTSFAPPNTSSDNSNSNSNSESSNSSSNSSGSDISSSNRDNVSSAAE
ncbi:MAG: Stk1 family PASTA domain-containing Ser/Thr kinase [Oscillospiraceae bacterium]|nr:Stk1 family PASTA domain-containing Ser/Thr kinase [Oscillospiraceae bacterium]